LINEPLQTLCGECHETDDEDFAEAHIHIEPAVMDCTTCHAPHASRDRNFFKDTVHAPFAKGDCEECHLVGQE
jgi:hypothetical protein